MSTRLAIDNRIATVTFFDKDGAIVTVDKAFSARAIFHDNHEVRTYLAATPHWLNSGHIKRIVPLKELKVFCATGPGGGVDPSCSPGGGAAPSSTGRSHSRDVPLLSDSARLAQLKQQWANLNNQLLANMDKPDSPEAQKLMDEMKANVKAMYQLHADPGGAEGIGKPGGARDMTIVGAGPGGLAAGIMGGADGLDTLIVDAQDKPGGQSKFSSRIENYPGF